MEYMSIDQLIHYLNKNYEVEFYSKDILRNEEIKLRYKGDLLENFENELVFIAKVNTNEKYLYGSQDGNRILLVYSEDGVNISNYNIIGGESSLNNLFKQNEAAENLNIEPINQNATDAILKDYILKDSEIVKYIGKEIIVYIPMRITKIGNCAFLNSNVEKVIFSDSIVSIGEKAFCNCKNLKSIKLSNMLEVIEDYAFENCAKLKSIFLSNTIVRIGVGVFSECSNLKALNIPLRIEKVPDKLCLACVKLSKIEFHDNIYEIGEDAFSNCMKIKIKELPKNLARIDECAFLGINVKHISIPAKVEIMGKMCFANCSKLKKVIVNKKTTIAKKAFQGSSKVKIALVEY